MCTILTFFIYPSVCDQASDCPNNGENYQCTDNDCECVHGFGLDGDYCVGMWQWNCNFIYY